uniref:Uncharacterized protein n=1 Tax=Timema genevievae TaxID=629358 RepID=A0A7R9PKI2_TIMGE|nr:unnamed protein product [Timema genevievae]
MKSHYFNFTQLSQHRSVLETNLCGNLLQSKFVIVNTDPTYWTGLDNRQQQLYFQAKPGWGPSTRPPNHLYQTALGKEHGPSNSSTHNLSATVPPREGLVCPPSPSEDRGGGRSWPRDSSCSSFSVV